MANNYIVYYLKFDSQEDADIILEDVEYLKTSEEFGKYYTVGDTPGSIDVVGEIWNDDGVYETDPETGELTVISEPTKKDGWHVNIILAADLPESLQQYIVEPATPSRRFAGF